MRTKSKVDESKIIALFSEDKTATDLSKETGYKIGVIYRVCKKHGLKYKKDRCGGKNAVDMTGYIFKDLTVTKRAGSLKALAMWECLCPCGKIFTALGSDLRQGKVKTCGCRTNLKSRRNWQGYEDIGKEYWSGIIDGANRRSLEFNITIEYIWEVFKDQNKKCILSGVDLSFKDKTASLDRIDNSKGYIEGNVQWVHKTVNKIKQSLTDEEFIYWCDKISRHRSLEREITDKVSL